MACEVVFVERLVVLVATAARGRIGGAALVARAALVLASAVLRGAVLAAFHKALSAAMASS